MFFYFLFLITNRPGEKKILLCKTNSLFCAKSQYLGRALRWQSVDRGLEDPHIFLKETRARKPQNMLPGEKKGGSSIACGFKMACLEFGTGEWLPFQKYKSFSVSS
jgi:hypothetical protein